MGSHEKGFGNIYIGWTPFCHVGQSQDDTFSFHLPCTSASGRGIEQFSLQLPGHSPFLVSFICRCEIMGSEGSHRAVKWMAHTSNCKTGATQILATLKLHRPGLSVLRLISQFKPFSFESEILQNHLGSKFRLNDLP